VKVHFTKTKGKTQLYGDYDEKYGAEMNKQQRSFTKLFIGMVRILAYLSFYLALDVFVQVFNKI